MDKKVEAVARALHRMDCEEEDAARKAARLPPVSVWEDPWQSSSSRQLERLRAKARGVLDALYEVQAQSPAPTSTAHQCWCINCETVRLKQARENGAEIWEIFGMRNFVVCPQCGNKRCPRATSHTLSCTGSNESGQVGSTYA